jgi:cytochrome c oxidase subunit 1
MFGGTGFAFFGAMHYWFPKIFGRMYNKRIATIAWALMFTGFNILYFSMKILGLRGMPRRYYDYLPQYADLNMTATVGSWILAAGLVLMFVNIIRGSRSGTPAGDNPWGSLTLEWTLSSPPPAENFPGDLVVDRGPYDYKAEDYKAEEG